MKIDKIELHNFKSAENLTIDFDDKVNVLVGVNGAGKTTVLQSIVICLSWLVARISKANGKGNYIKDSYIRYNSQNAVLSLTVLESDKKLTWQLVKTAKGHENKIKSELSASNELASLYREKLRAGNNLPVIVFYPVTRTVTDILPEYTDSYDNPIFEIYENSLLGGSNYHSFFEWFRKQEDIYNAKNRPREQWLQSQQKNITKYSKKILDSLTILLDKDVHLAITISPEPKENLYNLLNAISINYQYNCNEESLLITGLYPFIGFEISDGLGNVSQESVKNCKKATDNFFNNVQSVLDTSNNRMFVSIVWDIFISAYHAKLWWINYQSRNNILSLLYEFQDNIKDVSYHKPFNFNQLSDKIDVILQQEINRNAEPNNSEYHELTVVRSAIEQFIPEYHNLRVQRTPKPHMLIDKEDITFNLEHLSTGEKNMIALVGDIARRFAIANPQMDNPLHGDGVILIDEIDLHLHPSWQRLMIPRLTEIFPNCQFIITTHSPQVISHVQPHSLLLLNNDNNILTAEKATESYGKNIDRILEDILEVDTRPDDIIEKFNQLEDSIDDDNLDKAKLLVDELSSIIIGGDPELVRARAIIKRKEVLGR